LQTVNAYRLRPISYILGDLDGRQRQLNELWNTISRDDEARETARDVIRVMLTDLTVLRAQIVEYERWAQAALSRLQPLPTPLREE
jgi:hypothetical protein